jgi:hypothetical protein
LDVGAIARGAHRRSASVGDSFFDREQHDVTNDLRLKRD